MAKVDKEWIKKQIGKDISARDSILKSEREHRDSLKDEKFKNAYDQIIRDDERNLEQARQVGARYGYQPGSYREIGGGLLGSLKSAMEGVTSGDSFQALGSDLSMKSSAASADRVWQDIFHDIGDADSASIMERVATDDEKHEMLIRDAVKDIGLQEVRGERAKPE